jgi:MSHA biogenesis protein MshM
MASARVAPYLQHRLATAAASDATDLQIFETAAAQAIASYSGGVPRLVNVLAHKCLMLAYGENEHRVVIRHVALAAADTPGVQLPLPWWRRWLGGTVSHRTAGSPRGKRLSGDLL